MATPPNPQLELMPPPDMAESSAEYIGQMAAELASLAKSAHLDMLHYLLNMARLEAESHSFKENR